VVDYGALLTGAWRVTRQHRYLWLLGLFSFTTGSCSGGPSYSYRAEGDGLDRLPGPVAGFVDALTGNPALALALAAGVMGAFILLLAIGVVATAGLIAGTDTAHADLRSGTAGTSPTGLGPAWRAGLAGFWRLLGLWLFLLVVGGGLVIVVTLAFLLPLGIALANAGTIGFEGLTGVVIALLLGALLLLLLLVPLVIVVQIWLNLAHRSLILDGSGVFASLGQGWRLFGQNPGRCLVAWVIDAGLSLAVALVLAVPTAILAGSGALGRRAAEGGAPPLIALLVLGGLLTVLLLGLAKALVSTFFAAYWTIAYRELQTPAPYVASRREEREASAPEEAQPTEREAGEPPY
jgi:hypothetical protein